MDLNTKDRNFTGSGYRIHSTKLPLAAFWSSIKEYPQLSEKIVKYSSLFQEQIYMRLDLHFNQKNKSQQTNVCLKKQRSQRFTKMSN